MHNGLARNPIERGNWHMFFHGIGVELKDRMSALNVRDSAITYLA